MKRKPNLDKVIEALLKKEKYILGSEAVKILAKKFSYSEATIKQYIYTYYSDEFKANKERRCKKATNVIVNQCRNNTVNLQMAFTQASNILKSKYKIKKTPRAIQQEYYKKETGIKATVPILTNSSEKMCSINVKNLPQYSDETERDWKEKRKIVLKDKTDAVRLITQECTLEQLVYIFTVLQSEKTT